jgi:hypothetical protein
MFPRRIAVLTATLSLIMLPSMAWANIIAPTLVPGVAPLFGALAIPATILAALCESPFVRRAGVQRQPLFHSFNANLTSTFVGFLLLPIGLPALYNFGLFWVLTAVALSTWIEGLYYRKLCALPNDQLRWSPLIWGNVASTAILIAVSEAAYIIETPYRAWRIERFWWPLILVSVAGSAVGFLFGLYRALKIKQPQARSGEPETLPHDKLVGIGHEEVLGNVVTPVNDSHESADVASEGWR